jgi:DNA-binding NarL/FixJ family response regulator
MLQASAELYVILNAGTNCGFERKVVAMTQRLEFTPEIQAALQEERYHHHVPLVQRRMKALWLKSHGLPHWQIAKLMEVSENTLRAYFQLYAAGGLE